MSAAEDFIAAKLSPSRTRRAPYEQTLRVFHGWCRSNGYSMPDDDAFMDALESAGFSFVVGERGDWLISGAHLLPMGRERV
ncbi:hypothetical protein KBZ00_27055 [Streptomyces sp. RK31]|uniref:hypothetical protein n=1 Tax=Streptomyces sp. RK31 TaxID=2824892 RepID=UPI001B380744|nr:hypothetical protein [Streptomyces sp. RK31]MBQ0974759.1 hypothetical protein [Streptomyces sp. RK31]